MTRITYESAVAAGRASKEEVVRVEVRGDRAVVTLDQPQRLNTLSAAVTLQLKDRLTELAAQPGLRSVVLTGADPAFTAGGDLEMMEECVEQLATDDDEAGATLMWRWIRYEFGGIARLIAKTDKAFVAALNGPAAGVGLAFALTCDIAIASDRAVFVPAFGRLGLIPEVGTSWALTRRLGYQGAFAYYLAGRHLDAQAALEAGLVQEVVPHDELMAAAAAWCDRAAELPEHALPMTKALLRGVADTTWDAAITMEEFAEPSCFTTRAFADSVADMRKRRRGDPPSRNGAG